MKLEKSDYLLIKQLLLNSRESLTKLAKHIRKSRENTTYKLKRLTNKGLIKAYYASINVEALNFRQYSVFLQLVRTDKEKERELINFLKKQDYISWIGLLAGKWTLTFDIYAKDDKELTTCINQFLNTYASHVKDYLILPIDSKAYFYNKLFGFETNLNTNQSSKKGVRLDNTDLKILELLNKNSRITYAELSTQLKLTANAIKKRILQLELSGMIQGYSIIIDPKKLGLDWYGLQLKLLKFDPESTKKVETFLIQHKNIDFYYKYNPGIWNYDIGILVKNQTDFRNLLLDLENELSTSIQLSDFFFVIEEITENRLPRVIFTF